MPNLNTDLAALVGSRICHDLISPIGAINNVVELLTMAGASGGPEIGLIGESVDNASAKIRFLRIAFGAAGIQLVGPVEVQSILNDLYANSRLKIRWASGDAVPRVEVRLAFLAILCAEAGMPYGGQITVTAQPGKVQLSGEADRITVDAALWENLSSPCLERELQASHVQFALLPLLAADAGRRVRCQSDATTLGITI